MKQLISVMLVGLMMGACATTTSLVEPESATEVAPQIKDEETFHITTDMINPNVSCTRCGIVEQQRELEDIYLKVAEQAAAAGKTVEEFLMPPDLRNK